MTETYVPILSSKRAENANCYQFHHSLLDVSFQKPVVVLGKKLTKNRVNPILLSAVALGAYAIINGALSPSVAFTAIAVFSELEFVLSVVPELAT